MTGGSSRIASTLDLRPDADFESRSDVLRARADDGVAGQFRVLVRILVAAANRRPLVLYSSWGHLKPDLLACVLMSFWPVRAVPAIVLVGEMWQPNVGIRATVERFLVRRADRVIDRYLVPSQAEADLLPRAWPISRDKTRACRFYFFPPQHGLVTPVPVAHGSYIFSGGDSFRDYTPLLEAARQLPDVPFRIATLCLRPGDPSLPPNVTVHSVRYADYPALMAGASAVVVPLDRTVQRSAGILTYLMAMWLGKPVVVSDAVAVREYVDDKVTGIVVDGTESSYLEAISWVLEASNAAAVRAMTTEAHRVVDSKFRWDRYVKDILRNLDEVVELRRG